MIRDYAMQGPTERCCVGDRDLRPGERYVSVLLEVNEQLERRDYAADAWTGAPAEAIAHWSGRIPTESAPAKVVIDDDVLWDCFDRLADRPEPNQQQFRYVLALLLMRRKRVSLDGLQKWPTGDVLLLRDLRSGEKLELPDPALAPAELERVQAELFRVLGWA